MKKEEKIKEKLECAEIALKIYEDFDEVGYATYKGWIDALKWVLESEDKLKWVSEGKTNEK